jgi:hypothetical protein
MLRLVCAGGFGTLGYGLPRHPTLLALHASAGRSKRIGQ